jgi:serine/threonine protein kinase
MGADTDSDHPPGELHGTLPPGTRLRNYELVSVLGQGAFGITYRARDTLLGREVAIKEYLPASLAVRSNGTTVVPRSGDDGDTFKWGRDRFLDEARTLVTLEDAPAVVRVYDFLEANGTAYMVMALVRGETLEQRVRRNGPLDGPLVDRLTRKLLDGLEQVHVSRFLHRDIKPANIIVDPRNDPTLIDFGASRASIADRTSAMTAVFTPRYAAVEQLTSDEQGPWTDIYGLAVTLYFAVTGTPPPTAMERLLKDKYVPLSAEAREGFRAGLLRGIDAGLAVRSADRPQSVEAWRFFFNDGPASDATVVERQPRRPPPLPPPETSPPTEVMPPLLPSPPPSQAAETEVMLRPPPSPTPPQAAARPPPAPPPAIPRAPGRGRKVALIGGGGVALAAVLAAGYLWLSSPAGPESWRQASDALAAAQKDAEAKQRAQAEATAKAKAEADARAKADAEVKQKAEAAAKAQAEAEAKRQAEAEAQKKADAETARQQAAAEAQRKAEAEAEAKRLAGAAAKAKADADVKATAEAATKAEADAEAKRLAEAATKAKADADAKARAEAAAKAEADAEAKRQAQAAAKAQAEAATKAKADADAAARQKADDAAAAQKAAETTEAALNLSTADRQQVQSALTALGFDTQGVDGTFGPRTRDMIAAWQKARSLPPSGYLSVPQKETLFNEAALVTPRKPPAQPPVTNNGPRTPVSPPSQTANDPRCRSILQAAQLMGALADADRAYLRDHCH